MKVCLKWVKRVIKIKQMSLVFFFMMGVGLGRVEAHITAVVEPTELYIKGRVPLLNVDEVSSGLSLKHGTKVKVSLVNDKGSLYQPGLGQKPHGSMLVYVEGISTNSRPIDGFLSGFVYAWQLSNHPPQKIL